MHTVYKFAAPLPGQRLVHAAPAPFKILTLQLQNGVPTMWALVNTNDEKVECRFTALGTGHELPEWATRYVGTYQLPDGTVWHVWHE